MPPEAVNETDTLRAALEAAQRGEASWRGKAMENAGIARVASVNSFAAQEQAADASLQALQGEIDGIRSQKAGLYAEGKFEEAAELDEKMADAIARRREQQHAKAHWASQREVASKAPADPLANFSESERAWIDKNPGYLNDPSFQRKVNLYAEEGMVEKNFARGSKELLDYIDGKLKGGTPTAGRSETRQVDTGDGGTAELNDTNDSPFSDTGEADTELRQRHHTMDAAPVSNTTDPPVMRIDFDDAKPAGQQEPQARAVGRGGEGIRSVSAPPSRNVRAFIEQKVSNLKNVTLSPEEAVAARSLAESIEPDIAAQGDQAIWAWYLAMAKHPSHQRTRRRSWARDAVVV